MYLCAPTSYAACLLSIFAIKHKRMIGENEALDPSENYIFILAT